ncbi:MAG: sugar ABC transporter permease [Desulfobacterales bacterium]|nr:sugar ABC transporter permease [Desulfobacterales bacterium]
MIIKTKKNNAWLYVLPVLMVVAFNSIIPFLTILNYSIQDIFGPDQRIYVGFEWFKEILHNPDLHSAFVRQLLFSFCVLGIQIPLGIAISLLLPRNGWGVSVCLVLLALPLLIPWNVVGTIWQIFCRTDIGLGGAMFKFIGVDYNYASNYLDAWLTVLAMDVWHWVPLVILLCYSGLRAIPDAYYQAAEIDSASNWAVFRFIQLPKLRKVLVLAFFLRFMDSFMIYSEPFVLTGGGPGNSTTFLSQSLATMAIGQFDIGPAAAFSIIYYLFVLAICFIFYTGFMSEGTN